MSTFSKTFTKQCHFSLALTVFPDFFHQKSPRLFLVLNEVQYITPTAASPHALGEMKYAANMMTVIPIENNHNDITNIGYASSLIIH